MDYGCKVDGRKFVFSTVPELLDNSPTAVGWKGMPLPIDLPIGADFSFFSS